MTARLLLAIRDGRWVRPLSAIGVLALGAAAFLLSYDALHSLALASGVRPGLARIWPGVLDGFIVVATLTLVAAKRAEQPTWYPWTLVVLFAAASIVFNILHALGTDFLVTWRPLVASLVFAIPPVALVLATHLLLQQGAWQRHQHPTPSAPPSGTAASGTGSTPAASGTHRSSAPGPGAALPARARPTLPALASTSATAATRTSTTEPSSADTATRTHAEQIYRDALQAGRSLTGAELGRALGRSARYGRMLLAQFRTTEPLSGNGQLPPPGGER